MVGLFETSFTVIVTTALPRGAPIDKAISVLHDCATLTSMTPNWRTSERKTPSTPQHPSIEKRAQEVCEYWEVEEDVPWIPKWLRNGTMKSLVVFSPVFNGCDLTARAKSTFTSTEQWRLVRGQVLSGGEVVLNDDDDGVSGWLLQTVSNVVCMVTFAGFFRSQTPISLKSVHAKIIDIIQGDVS